MDSDCVRMIVKYPFCGQEEDELSLRPRDIVDVMFAVDDWWFGRCNGRSGLFPKACVKLTGQILSIQENILQSDLSQMNLLDYYHERALQKTVKAEMLRQEIGAVKVQAWVRGQKIRNVVKMKKQKQHSLDIHEALHVDMMTSSILESTNMELCQEVLSELRLEIIQKADKDDVFLDHLTDHLDSKRCLKMEQIEIIKRVPTCRGRCKKLLEFLSSASRHTFLELCDAIGTFGTHDSKVLANKMRTTLNEKEATRGDARKDRSHINQSPTDMSKMESLDAAAVKVQAYYRGYAVRKHYKLYRQLSTPVPAAHRINTRLLFQSNSFQRPAI